MSDEEKAKSIFDFLVTHTYHWASPNPQGDRPDDDVHDPVRFLNVYGYGFCDDASRNFAVLARAAGLPARIWYLNGHVVAEAHFDDAWHMFDVDHRVYYDVGDHIASVEELELDPRPLLKSPRDPIGYDTALLASMYTSTEDNRALEEKYRPSELLAPRLEPGDQVSFLYSRGTKFFSTECDAAQAPPSVGNGMLTRDLTESLTGHSTESRAVFEWPYLLLDATLRLRVVAPASDIDVTIRDVNRVRRTNLQLHRELNGVVEVPLDFNCGSEPVYRVEITLTSRSATPLRAIVTGVQLEATFQFAPRMLPDFRKHQLVNTTVDSEGAKGRVVVEFLTRKPRKQTTASRVVRTPTVDIRSGGRLDSPHITVPVNTPIRWLAVEGGHDVTFDDGTTSGPLHAGMEFTRQFDTAGVFRYGCSTHGEGADRGDVTVFKPTRNDFDIDDRADLLWWNATTATLRLWLLDDHHFRSAALMDHAAGSDWLPECTGDVNGDGFTDIVWRNVQNGALHIWMLRRALYTETLIVQNAVPPGWRVAAVLPHDSSDRTGLLLEDPETGKLEVWRLNRRSAETCEPLSAAIDPPSRFVGVADFDDDDALDIAVWNPVTKEISYLPLDRADMPKVVGSVQSSGWEPALISDTDGDGEPNVVWRNQGTGEVNIWSLRDGVFWKGEQVGTVTQPGWSLVP